jgi:xanthine dehydrogenase accessory factor
MGNVKFYNRIVQLLEEGKGFAVAEIVDIKGSVPQSADAKMIIYPDRSSEFTIGGGGFEARVIEDSINLLFNGEKRLLKKYNLTPEELEMPCEGEVTVAFEAHQSMLKLLIFGGGHIGRMLGRLASETGLFHIIIVDDRQDYADPQRHPGVSRTIHTDEYYNEGIPQIDERTFIVLATRSFETDQQLLERFANVELAYLGMIGSEKRKKRVFDALEKKGVSVKPLERIHTPVGLPIGGKSPGEIAVSILAELIQIKNQTLDSGR